MSGAIKNNKLVHLFTLHLPKNGKNLPKNGKIYQKMVIFLYSTKYICILINKKILNNYNL